MMRISGLESVGWALLNSFWQMGLLALFYQLITGRNTRFSANVRHNIALAFSFGGTLWFVSGLLSAGNTVSLPPLALSGPGTPSAGSFLFSREYLLRITDQVVAFLPWLYLTILVLRTGHRLLGWMQRIKSPKTAMIPGFGSQWEEFLDKCRREMGIRRAVILRWTTGPAMARTYGFLKPVVLFPVALQSRLTVAQVEAILVHELAHIRRNDYLTHLWMSLFRFIFYFNPFAGFLYEAVSSEREKACDDLVLDRSYPALVYAQALVTLERFRQTELMMALAASGQAPLQLAERVRRITGLPVPRAGHPRWRLAGLVLLFALSCYSFGPAFKQNRPAEKPLPADTDIVRVKTQSLTLALSPVQPSLAVPEVTVVAPPPPPVPVKKTIIIRPSSGEVLPETAPDVQVEDSSLSTPDENEFPMTPPGAEAGVQGEDATENSSGTAGNFTITVQPDFAAKKQTRNFSYSLPGTAAAPSALTTTEHPFVPASSFAFPVADSVPAIALQSLRQNKAVVVQLLAKWKALQLQQNISRSLEAKYQLLKDKAQKDLNTLPEKKDELKRSLQNLQQQMKLRKAEMDRLSTALAEEPVIYI